MDSVGEEELKWCQLTHNQLISPQGPHFNPHSTAKTNYKTQISEKLVSSWRASETLFSHVYGNSRYIYIYVRLLLIRMRALVFCELNSRARKRNDFLA